jgi:putative chitinase
MHPITPELLRNLSLNGDWAIISALAPEMETSAYALCASADEQHAALRLAHFLAQACYETFYFKRLEESLSYSAERIGQIWPHLKSRAAELANNPKALGNAAYADHDGNGAEASGDGWHFRGRGLLGLTGRTNYAQIGKLIAPASARVDIEADPDLVSQPHWATATAVAFWTVRRINAAADEDDIGRVTRLVNGGTEGIAERAILKHRALKLLSA